LILLYFFVKKNYFLKINNYESSLPNGNKYFTSQSKFSLKQIGRTSKNIIIEKYKNIKEHNDNYRLEQIKITKLIHQKLN
jgi:hypothetical protein